MAVLARKGGTPDFVFSSPRRTWYGMNPFSGVTIGHSLCGTSSGLDTISGYLAVRIMRNPLASASCKALDFSSGWRPPHAFWTNVECGGDRGQCWSNAGRRNASHLASLWPNVGSCNTENAAVISGGPSKAGTVQYRRSHLAFWRHSHCRGGL